MLFRTFLGLLQSTSNSVRSNIQCWAELEAESAAVPWITSRALAKDFVEYSEAGWGQKSMKFFTIQFQFPWG